MIIGFLVKTLIVVLFIPAAMIGFLCRLAYTGYHYGALTLDEWMEPDTSKVEE